MQRLEKCEEHPGEYYDNSPLWELAQLKTAAHRSCPFPRGVLQPMTAYFGCIKTQSLLQLGLSLQTTLECHLSSGYPYGMKLDTTDFFPCGNMLLFLLSCILTLRVFCSRYPSC